MSFFKSMEVKSVGRSKCLWLPKEWGIRKGDMLYVQSTIDGKTYHTTTNAKQNCSIYIIIPHFWNCEKGDIIDVKIAYASVPIRPEPDDPDTEFEDSEDEQETDSDDPGAETQTAA